jgi:hypothetical protein
MLVHVDTATLDLSRQGLPGTGNIHLSFGNLDFPETEWSDFVIVILGWWLEAVTRLLDDGTGVLLRFMDGPLGVMLEPTSQVDRWRATARRNDVPYPDLPEGMEISRLELIASLREAARTVLDECNRRGVESPDIQELATGLGALAKAEKDHR